MADRLFSGGAAFGNPNLARQVARTKELQAARSYDVNTLPDPQTYAFAQGFFGEAPDQLGFSRLHPDYAKIIGRGEQGMLSGGVSMIGPTAQAIKGLAGIGVRALGPTAGRMAEGYLQRQGLMPGVVPNFPTSITNRNEIKNLANDFADQFKQMGFDVTVDHSGSKAGASSYLRVSDPQTGRFLNKPIRISDHSKGAKELDANINVLNPQEDFAKITSALNDMRAKGDTLVFKQDRYAQELIASGVKPKTAYQRARVEITENQPSPYPQQAALDLAQQRAALPIEQGGLGLPVGNTAMDRAKAMKFEERGFHETEGSNIESGLTNFDVRRAGAAASDEQTPYAMFIKPHGQSIGIAKKNPAQMPLMVKSNLTDENIMQAFGNREELQQYLNQFPDIQKATEAVSDLDKKMANYMGEIQKKADDLYAQGKTEQGDKLLDSLNVDSNLMKEFDLRINELSAKAKEQITNLFKSQGIGTVGLQNDAGAFGRKTITEMVLEPNENVRSRFAAFDPFRRSAAIAAAMGVTAPNLMAGQDNEMPEAVRQYMANPMYSDPFADSIR